jgi:Spy/CpxP family protein refolding chaperone
MNRKHHKISFSLFFLSLVLGSALVLSSCATEQQSTDNNTVEESSTVDTEKQTKSDDSGANPLTVGLEGSERPGTDPLQLLQNSQIQQELNISSEQNTKLASLEQEFRSKINQTVADINLNDLSSEEQEAKLKEIRATLSEETAATRNELETILSPDQVKRMRGIFLQVYGWGVLTRYELAEDLQLTTEQQKQLDDIEQDMLTKMRTNWEVPPEDNPQERNKVIAQNRQKMEQIIKNSNEQSLAVLTPEQQQKLETIKGEKFELDPKSLPSPEV